MIPRYTRDRMGQLWSEENKLRVWLQVELAVCEAWAELGVIPQKALREIKEKARVNPQRVKELERETRHDVAAFVMQLEEAIGEAGRWVHFGLTSYDVVDTALSLLLKEALGIILEDLEDLMEAVKERAFEHRDTVMIGRTHGVHAEPITFGLKLALWYEELKRHRGRLRRAREGISVGKVSGAVGTYAHVPPQVEEYVCRRLGLRPAPISSQIVQRDRHAEVFAALALLASSIEKFALEIRHLQRTEVLEAEEPFAEGQKGSSAMPHKRNPIGSENLCGLARVVRANLMAALEDVPLWHERDISHSSVERIIAPDSTILIDFMLWRLSRIVKGMRIYPERMRENLERTRGLIFSQAVMLELIRKGLPRQEAYRMVQRNAMKAWEGEEDFRALVKGDVEIRKFLTEAEIEECFSLKRHLRHVNFLFRRVFEGKEEEG
ncbi:MAG: adenylosuccinate lyase [Deltaproteobacteria bacterium]|nr:MAG: adenylosuccinate lyase [Deltaproteobacteria bacterium]